MRKSTFFLWGLVLGLFFLFLIPLHAHFTAKEKALFLGERRALVSTYGLTDLCLFTDARYTRNPAMADMATAFQDHPMSLEHFPSGSIITPPQRVRNGLD